MVGVVRIAAILVAAAAGLVATGDATAAPSYRTTAENIAYIYIGPLVTKTRGEPKVTAAPCRETVTRWRICPVLVEGDAISCRIRLRIARARRSDFLIYMDRLRCVPS